MPAKQVKIRRGTTAEHSVFVGEIGEITVDTTKNTVVVHDKTLQGGNPLAKENMSNVFNSVGIQQLEVTDGSANDVLTTNGMGGLSFGPINISSQLTHGGDLSGTVSNAQIVPKAVGINELDVSSDGSNGQALITNGSGQLSFGNFSVAQNSIGVIELNLSDGTSGQVLTTDGNANLSFQTPVTNPVVGGDLSGLASNAQIVNNAVGVPELDLNDGTAGQVLSTNGSGVLSFIDADPTGGAGGTFGGGVITGTVANANIANNAITSAMIGPGVIVAQDIATNAVGVTELNVADGNAGEFLQTNGSGVLSFATAASTLTGGGTSLVSIQTFGSVVSANGTGNGFSGPNITTHTWTKPAGVTRVLYFVTGGGGGDGIFSHNGDGTQANPAQAIIRGYGGGGGTVMGFLDVTNIVSETVTVGSCGGNFLGNALNSPGNPEGISSGSAGEASTFGTHATAFGGGGGLSGVNGGSGVNPNDTTAFAAGNPGGGGGTGGSVQMRGSASSAGPTPGTSFWGETPGGGNGNINRANQGGSGIVVILEFA